MIAQKSERNAPLTVKARWEFDGTPCQLRDAIEDGDALALVNATNEDGRKPRSSYYRCRRVGGGVQMLARDGKSYTVTATSCDCPDSVFTPRSGGCKHRVALGQLMQELHDREEEAIRREQEADRLAELPTDREDLGLCQCPACDGSGRHRSGRGDCDACDGWGTLTRTEVRDYDRWLDENRAPVGVEPTGEGEPVEYQWY